MEYLDNRHEVDVVVEVGSLDQFRRRDIHGGLKWSYREGKRSPTCGSPRGRKVFLPNSRENRLTVMVGCSSDCDSCARGWY